VSHRGNTRGAGAGDENTLAALAAARRAGFRWVEIDVRLTADAVAVVAHDNELGGARIDRMTQKQLRASPAGRRVPTLEEVLERFGKTLSFCLEIKLTDEVAHNQETVRQVLRALRGLPASTRVIVDSFSRTSLATVRAFSRREVGYDLPQSGPVKDRWLDYAAGAGFHWVYVLARFADADLVRRAHRRGLKVMVYTIDDPRGLARFGADPPDGVMTDHARLLGDRVAPATPRR
jgi:glycerophosphoryl diester phosphodiesterase